MLAFAVKFQQFWFNNILPTPLQVFKFHNKLIFSYINSFCILFLSQKSAIFATKQYRQLNLISKIRHAALCCQTGVTKKHDFIQSNLFSHSIPPFSPAILQKAGMGGKTYFPACLCNLFPIHQLCFLVG